MQREEKSIWPEVLFFAALWAVWFGWFYHAWPFWDDHAVFHLMAANWLHGGRPYIDAIDPNWPGAILPHLIAFALSGYQSWGFRLVDTLAQVALVAVTFHWLAAWGVRRLWRVLAVTLYTLAYFNGTFGTMGQREGLALPLLIFGLLPWLLPVERVETFRWPRLIFLHGVCLGLAAAIKPPLGLLVLVVGAATLLTRAMPWRLWLRCVGRVALGGFAAWSVIALALWRSGSLAAFWQWGVVFAFSDYVGDVFPWSQRFWHTVKWLSVPGAATALMACVALFGLYRSKGSFGPLAWRSLWFTLGALATALVQGKTNCFYHFLPFLFGLAALTAAWLEAGVRDWSNVRIRLAWIAVILVLLLCGVGASRQSRLPTSGFALGQQLRGDLRPGEKVLAIGFAPTLYLALEQPAPYPLLNSMLFYTLNEPRQLEEERRLLVILRDPKTRYFILDSIVFATQRPWTRIDRHPHITTYLREHYRAPVIREVRGNPLEFAEPVQYLIYEHLPDAIAPVSSGQ